MRLLHIIPHSLEIVLGHPPDCQHPCLDEVLEGHVINALGGQHYIGTWEGAETAQQCRDRPAHIE